jgi:uncharacterized protein
MVVYLGISEEEASEKYWRVNKKYVQMRTIEGHCIFYRDGCHVHDGRPWRCAQWPLHPSILIDKANFETIRESCPGIKQDISYEEFCEILRGLI